MSEPSPQTDAPLDWRVATDGVVGGRFDFVTSLRRSAIWPLRAGLFGVCLLALLVGSVGITNEGYVSLEDDMPRYVMNGVYFHDLARDHPFGSLADVVEYTKLYYARYPALSIGHHPPLLSVAEAPLYALFGVSIGTARLVPLFSFVAATALLYMLVAELYGVPAGLLAAAFFTSSPFIVISARTVMSEMPTLALVLASAYSLKRFCATEHRGALVAFVLAEVLSLYAKQLAIFVVPAFLVTALVVLGVRRLFQRDVLVAVGAIIVLALPLVPMTLILSPTNVRFATSSVVHGASQGGLFGLVRSALDQQFAWPVVALAVCGAARAAVMRDRRSILFLLWFASVAAGVDLVGRYDATRYSIDWAPAVCALAASLIAGWRSRIVKISALALLVAGVGVQAVAASHVSPAGAVGYEEAAQFVLQSSPGPTVLFSGDIDSGYFAFFVRKHDPARQLVVLRSDKVFTTSFLATPDLEDRIHRPEEIDAALHRFGTRFVVLEDRPSRSPVLEWLRQELQSPKFTERRRIPIGTTDAKLRGTSLVVYEFNDVTPADTDAVLSLHLPLVRRAFDISLSDLVARKYLR